MSDDYSETALAASLLEAAIEVMLRNGFRLRSLTVTWPEATKPVLEYELEKVDVPTDTVVH